MTAATHHPERARTDDELRAGLRRFLDEHHPGRPPADVADRRAWQRRWAAQLFDAGWAGPSWPREWGGLGLPLTQQVAYHEEIARARVPRHPSPNIFTVGPTLILHGTDQQRERFLLPMLRGDELWAQGFSEPDAGSDLPALTTSAVRDGDHYVVTGQKVWSTAADESDWLFTLVRTGPPGSRQQGITYLLIDLRSPGITVRPLRDLTGRSDFCEIFLDAVRVPVSQRVGSENGGWGIARTSLGHERSVAIAARATGYSRVVTQLVELAQATGRSDEPVLRQRLAEAAIHARILHTSTQRLLSIAALDGEPGPLSSVLRLFFAEFEQRLHELGVDLLGPFGALGAADPHAPQRGRWTWGLLRTRASTIGAGTAEIQRNTIAERILGLPRDPDTTGGEPWESP